MVMVTGEIKSKSYLYEARLFGQGGGKNFGKWPTMESYEQALPQGQMEVLPEKEPAEILECSKLSQGRDQM